MVNSFFLYHNKLDQILKPSNNEPLNETEQDTVQEFVDFVFDNVGKNHNKSDFATNKKESTHAAKWLIDAGVTGANESLEKLKKHSSSYEGMKKLMFDCVNMCYQTMIKTLPSEHEPGTDPIYNFGVCLSILEVNRQIFKSNDGQGPIDLTH